MQRTTVFTFKIKTTFDEWLTYFDSEDSYRRLSELNINPLYRGRSSTDPQKVIVIHQYPEGNMEKFFEKHGSWIATHGIEISSIEMSDWL